jgi:type IV pilus assembly protein PilF
VTRTHARRPVAVALAVLALAGCVSDNGGRPPTSEKDAAQANMQLGVAYMQQGNLALAKEKLERAGKQDPRNPELQTSLAFLYERLGRPRDAEARYREAMRLSPGSASVNNNYGVFLCRGGKPDDAIKRFETAARDPLYATPWAALTNAAVCLRSVKRGDDAVRYLQQSIQLRPNYDEAVMELADLQLESGQALASRQTVDRFLSMGRATPPVLLIGVRAALAQGDRTAVEAYSRRLRRDFPDSAQTRMLPQLLGDRG